MNRIEEELFQESQNQCIDFFGIADLVPYQDRIAAEFSPLMASYPRALSIGIRLPDPVVNQLPNRLVENHVRFNYRHHAYTLINQRLDMAASIMSSLLQNRGYQAFPVAASQQVDTVHLGGMVSHKMVARLAGLGWIGKSCLLITRQAGPRVRWASILTDCPLETKATLSEDGCGECQECVDHCPVNAFTGASYREGEPRSARYDAHRCNRYLDKLEEMQGIPAVCGMCLYICPYGRQQIFLDKKANPPPLRI
jgi:epoxyqueuosine reductase